MNASILLLPGDGIGPEVVAAAERVLRTVADRCNHSFNLSSGAIGGAALAQGLPPLPDDTLTAARAADAILLGAVGDPKYDTAEPSERPEAALLKIIETAKAPAPAPDTPVYAPAITDFATTPAEKGYGHGV